MQSISVVFSTLHCEGYIADFRYRWLITSGSARWLIEILSEILKSMRTIAFWETTRSPAFRMHKFMSEYLIVNIWRDNFTSDFLTFHRETYREQDAYLRELGLLFWHIQL